MTPTTAAAIEVVKNPASTDLEVLQVATDAINECRACSNRDLRLAPRATVKEQANTVRAFVSKYIA